MLYTLLNICKELYLQFIIWNLSSFQFKLFSIFIDYGGILLKYRFLLICVSLLFSLLFYVFFTIWRTTKTNACFCLLYHWVVFETNNTISVKQWVIKSWFYNDYVLHAINTKPIFGRNYIVHESLINTWHAT